jgi:long-chain fatty acid transport protein
MTLPGLAPRRRRCGTSAQLLFVALACVPLVSQAGNGLNLIGFGAESVGMGGADIAVARDATALNTNPAGLTQLRATAFDNYIAAAYAIDVAHADRFGNDRGVTNDIIGLGGFGFAKPLGSSGITVGIGAFAQGGAGNVYKNLNTPFGGQGELSGLIAIGRMIPGIAWRVDDKLSIGLGVAVTYARAKQHVFPGVSVFDPANPSQSFFGTITKDLQTTRFGARAGVRYEITPSVALAAVYSPKTALPLKDGYSDVNLSALGLGVVRYRDMRVEGLALPQEVGVGAAWHATPSTLLSLELTWLDWSGALKSQTITASNPESASAPAVIRQTLDLNWRDQYVIALGAAQDIDDRLTLYGGFNYARNPVPAPATSPLLAPTGERHATAGVRYRLSGSWILSAALEYLLPKKVTYNNPQSPFGPGAQERTEYIAVHLMLGKRW